MASNRSTWRAHPFQVGRTYIALQSFKSLQSQIFLAGRQYELAGISYSHYDGSTVLSFLDQENMLTTQWWWHDDEADALCEIRFRIC